MITFARQTYTPRMALLAGTFAAIAGHAAAQSPAPAATTEQPAATGFSGWASSIKLGGSLDAGITGNTSDPASRRNFGQLLNDNANRPELNQLNAIVSRDVDPKSTDVDVGFRVQMMYGSDSRIYHTLGVFDQLIHDRNQLDVTEASVSIRLPGLFANGTDIKAGIYPTPLGVEVIDPAKNPFYSHSYIFQYGLPFKHTGVLATAHVSDMLDLYLGVDSGTDTFIAYGSGDNNNRPGGIAGLGLNLLGGDLTILALTHIGPENSKHNTTFANDALRYFNDVAITYKLNPKLTLTGELNYVRDDGFRADGYGAAAYASYALTDNLTLNARAEVFRDNNNFFVATPVADRDFVLLERGNYSRFLTAPRATTYSEYTLGVTYKIPDMPKAFSTALVRPELRYDRALNNSKPYNDGTDRGVFTLSADLVLAF